MSLLNFHPKFKCPHKLNCLKILWTHPSKGKWLKMKSCPVTHSTMCLTASPPSAAQNSIFNIHVHGYGSWPIMVHQLQQAQKQHLQHPCSWLWQLVHYCPPASTGSKTASSTPMFMVMAAGQLLSPSFNRLKNSIFNIHIHGDVSWPIIPKASAQ